MDKFTVLRKILKAIGLSEERISELIATIESWLSDDKEAPASPQFPYRLRDDFLSPAEQNFFLVLKATVSDWALICPKVSLGDLFYAQTGDSGRNQSYRNKIDRKHIDFLLCDPQTARPLVGIELDDKSHRRPDRQERDQFVDGVFAAASLPLVHIPVQSHYPTAKLNAFLRQKAGLSTSSPAPAPTEHTPVVSAAPPPCPTCGQPMVLRTAKRGRDQGNSFWGCADFPHCRGILPVT
jgi:predicted RNA-binding Zn-ribbon protein involved in translation (DUF1610 family)